LLQLTHIITCSEREPVLTLPRRQLVGADDPLNQTMLTALFVAIMAMFTNDHADYKSRVHLLSDLNWYLQAHMLAELKSVDLG